MILGSIEYKVSCHFYRPRTEYNGRLCFYRCLSVNRGRGVPRPSPDMVGYLKVPTPLPQPGPDRGRGYPKVPTPCQVQTGGYPKVPTPPGPDGGGVPKVPTPQVQMGEGIPQGTYPPGPDRGGEGMPKVPTLPPPPGKVPTPHQSGDRGRGYPRYLSPPAPPIRCGRYASCVHTGLCCSICVNLKTSKLSTLWFFATSCEL